MERDKGCRIGTCGILRFLSKHLALPDQDQACFSDRLHPFLSCSWGRIRKPTRKAIRRDSKSQLMRKSTQVLRQTEELLGYFHRKVESMDQTKQTVSHNQNQEKNKVKLNLLGSRIRQSQG